MVARIIDGKAVAAGIRDGVARGCSTFAQRTGRRPGLAVVLVGSDPASEVYVRSKVRLTQESGMVSFEYRLPVETKQEDLLALLRILNDDQKVDGILVQLPLPAQIDANTIIMAIDPSKDVDGLHPENAGRLANNMPGLAPCTPLGSMLLVKQAIPDLSGLEALVLGRSVLVGKPMAQMLLNANATVVVAHSKTRALPELCRRADILIAAVGRPELVRGNWIKPGAVVIDVGINRLPSEQNIERSRLIGDVAFDEAKLVAGAITPVPGGVGPMTIACLLQNTLTAAERHVAAPE